MGIIKKALLAVVPVVGIFAASPSMACIAGPYESLPETNYSDYLPASQNARLYAGSSLYSQNGLYRLTFQQDGNLVFYKVGQAKAIWATGTLNCLSTPYTTSHARFQGDGNLVVYYKIGSGAGVETAMWDTNTQGHPNARLYVQNDGAVVIYDGNKVLWASNR